MTVHYCMQYIEQKGEIGGLHAVAELWWYWNQRCDAIADMTECCNGWKQTLEPGQARMARNLFACESTAGIPGAMSRQGWWASWELRTLSYSLSSLLCFFLVRFAYRNPKVPEINVKDGSKDLSLHLPWHKSMQLDWRDPYMLKELSPMAFQSHLW